MDDAARLEVALTESDATRLLTLLEELERWNRTYNLTAIAAADRITHHLLDSLAIQQDLRGATVADVGTGAGFPGLPLAVVNPQRRFTLIDANGKKVRFVAHAARSLELTNVEALHARVESTARQFDTVMARAFAALPELVAQVAPLCGPGTRVLALKGQWPQAELDALPPQWQVVAARRIEVPGLDAARCVITLQSSGGGGMR